MAMTDEELKKLEDELQAYSQDEELQSYLNSIKEKQQIKQKESEISTNPLEAFARSTAQGLTSEFADELTARAESMLTDTPYEQAVEESRKEYKKSEQEYPLTSLAGQITGSVGQALGLGALLPGAGAAPGAGRAAQAAYRLKNLIMPTTKGGFLPNVKNIAKAGAIQGAATEVGMAEDMDTAASNITSGALGGAATGLILGGATEGIKKGAGALGKKISEGIDRGEYPEVFKQMRTGIRTGLEGIGFSTPAEKSRLMKEAENAAEKVVPEIGDNLRAIGDLRQRILDKAKVPVKIEDVVQSALDELKDSPYDKANKLRKQIKLLYLQRKNKFPEGQQVYTPADAYALASEIEGIFKTGKNLNRNIKSLGIKTVSELKKRAEDSVDTRTALAALSEDPQALAQYSKYLERLSPEELIGKESGGIKDIKEATQRAKELSQGMQMMAAADPSTVMEPIKQDQKTLVAKIRTAKQAEKKANEIREAFRMINATIAKEDPTILTDMIKPSQQLIEQIINESPEDVVQNLNPIRKLNEQMNKLLTSTEILGIKKGDNFESKRVKDFEKIFRNILEQSKDTKTGYIDQVRYRKAMEQLEGSFPELADKIKSEISPIIDKLQFKSYVETGAMDSGVKEPGIIKSFIGNVGQLGASAANIGSQIYSAAEKGAPGPLKLGVTVPTTTILRPVASTLNSMKTTVDDMIAARASRGADPGIWKGISEKIDNALMEKDEARRAAILNTLMQYSVFRNLIGKPTQEKK